MKAWLVTLVIEVGKRLVAAILKKWDEYQKKKEIKRKTKEIIRTTPDPQERARKINELVNGK